MNKMAGVILMVVGALILGVGFVVYSTSTKDKVEEVVVTTDEVDKKEFIEKSVQAEVEVESVAKASEIKRTTQPIVQPIDNELEKVIEMAIADGVLTTNERELIKKTAISKGVDYVEVLEDVEKRVELLEIDSETQLVNLEEKNGLEFEQFIVQKFSKKVFTLKEWAGDKYVNGVYAETTQHSDLLLEFTAYNQSKEIAVECKWRHKSVNDGIPFSTKEQLDRYRKYAKEKNIPVFMTIGLGGKGGTPKKLYIVPLEDISKPFMFLNQLRKYEKNIDANFYYDYKKEELR